MKRIAPGEILCVRQGFLPIMWSTLGTVADAFTAQIRGGTVCLVVASSSECVTYGGESTIPCYLLCNDGKLGWCYIANDRWERVVK